jgi:hypothetical protein
MSDDPRREALVRAALSVHAGPLARYAARLGGSPAAAEDAVQETLLRLWAEPAPPDDDHLAQWLFTVCRNRCLDVCRKERRLTLMSEHVERTCAGSELPPDDVASGREQAGRVPPPRQILHGRSGRRESPIDIRRRDRRHIRMNQDPSDLNMIGRDARKNGSRKRREIVSRDRVSISVDPDDDEIISEICRVRGRE